jgi:predicted amidohydrolase YtcJ
MAPRPVLHEQALQEFTEVTRVIASHRWPIRIHATYDEPITRILDVFEQVFKETDYRSRWAIDHAETIPTHNIARVKALGGGIAIQNCLAFIGGDVVYSAPPFTTFAPEQFSSVHPEWSPVAVFGGFQRADEA